MFKFFRKKKSLIESTTHETFNDNTHVILQFDNVGYLLEYGIPVLGTLKIKYKVNKKFTLNEFILKEFIDKLTNTFITEQSHETSKIAVYTSKIYGYIQNEIESSDLCFVPISMFNNLNLDITFTTNNSNYIDILEDSQNPIGLIYSDIESADKYVTSVVIPSLSLDYSVDSKIKSSKFHTNIYKTELTNNKTIIIHQENAEGVISIDDIMRYILVVRKHDYWSIQYVYDNFIYKLISDNNSLVVVVKENIAVDVTRFEVVYNNENDYVDDLLNSNNILTCK